MKHLKNAYCMNQDPKIKGERCADIPGYEDYYQASNFGRVRSVDRVIQHPRLNTQFIKGKLLRQKVNINKFTLTDKGEPSIDLSVCLARDGKPKYINVRRLVWMAFSGILDFVADRKVVVNKGANGFNNRLSNLRLWTEIQKGQRMVKRGGASDYLKTAVRSKCPKRANNKPVGRYSINSGKLLQRYRSITEAPLKTCFDEKGIIAVCKGRFKQWRGNVWRYI